MLSLHGGVTGGFGYWKWRLERTIEFVGLDVQLTSGFRGLISSETFSVVVVASVPDAAWLEEIGVDFPLQQLSSSRGNRAATRW